MEDKNMVVNQVYSFLNTIAPMMWGHDYVDTIDTTGLIDYGNHVLNSATDIDKFCSALVDRIGKTVIRNLDLDINYPNLIEAKIFTKQIPLPFGLKLLCRIIQY